MGKWTLVFTMIFLLAVNSISSVFAVERLPKLDEKISVTQAVALAKYLSMSSKFKINDRQIIKDLDVEIDKRIVEDRENPVLWFFKGRISALLLTLRNREMKKNNMTREQRLNDLKYIELKVNAVDAYKHALKFDSYTNVPMKLNVIMLANIDRYVFSDADMQVEASRKMLARVEEHPEEHPPTEDWNYQIYGNIVTSYVDEKRYDEALAVLEEMKEMFSYPSKLKEIEDAIKRTEYRKAKAMQEVKSVEENQVAESKPKQVQKASDKPQAQKVIPAPIQRPQKQPKMISEPKPQQSDTNKAPLISPKLVMAIIIMAAVILSVFIYLRRKKQ